MISILGIVPPPAGELFQPDPWSALSILAGLAAVTVIFQWISGRLGSELSRIADDALSVPPPMPPPAPGEPRPLDPSKRTVVLLVTGFNALGVRSLVVLWESLPQAAPQILFLAALEEGSDSEKDHLRSSLRRYLPIADVLGMSGDVGIVVAPDPALDTERACLRIAESFTSAVFCSGKLRIHPARWIHRFLPDAAPEAVRKRLHRRGLPTVSLGVRVEMKKAATRAAAFSG